MAYRVQILGSDQSFSVEPGESVLQAAGRADVRLPHECTFGGCGTCRIKLESGAVDYEEFPMALTEEEAQQGYALACQARPLSDLCISAASGRRDFPEPRRLPATVRAIEPLCDDVIHLTLDVPEDLEYVPGQYMNVVLPGGQTRSFSMASASGVGRLDFHVRRIPGGFYTDRWLGQARPGAAVEIEAPLGVFSYHEEDWRPMIMMATGTGIAPIKAILESLLDSEDCPPITLYWGMRTEADLYLRKQIESWAPRLYEFNFVPVLSRPADGWRGRRGHVQHAVLEDHEDLSDHAFYLCGAPGMIQEARHLFAQRGASLDHMYADSFTFQHPLAAAA
ncbi:CDP-6-deoxy-delta-3,4-glucoseen reductase [Achromobacter sp. DMS1]|uniref:2Fe-2S iron-sulfur cluster-binding protein n=1 Tax=Achromobacter sp. DMS1 TaxID=1688405 RepID=UPI00069EAE57|nr:2Fe-2S iron-sulfur cluster-binding protein [Achromobacter sp. DMS1]KOF53330.1 CDP-6-deoxy-delta-3,4-glucoseen reductase [Achromobacter sp. DMS1]KOF53773.1 CDP-6-deoxy-delta-3,4-glucoseen reductase [Achromobacter sp. DMS1]